MPTPEEFVAKIRALGWPELRLLWERIKLRDTPDWGGNNGKAFEYLVLRAFQLDEADVHWPYKVTMSGQIVEEIDGSVRVGGLYCLVESKDEDNNIAIAPIFKLRNQLLRRPSGTFGIVFSSGEFTDPAIQLAHFALPQAILLWTGEEVEYTLNNENICTLCELKYRMCVDQGIPDFDVRTGGIAWKPTSL